MDIKSIESHNLSTNFTAKSEKTKKRQNSNANENKTELMSKFYAQAVKNSAKINHSNVNFKGGRKEAPVEPNKETYAMIGELIKLKTQSGEPLLEKNAINAILKQETSEIREIINLLKNAQIKQPVSNVEYKKLQNSTDTELKLISNFTSEETKTEIRIIQIIKSDGTSTTERTERHSDDTSISWYIGDDNFFESSSYDDEKRKPKSLIEVIYDKTSKEPIAILHTKASEILEGVWDKTLYQLSDYDENYDVLKAIKDGTIKGGKKLSEAVKNPDGTITYIENLDTNGTKIQRKYTKGINGIDYNYSYQITDEEGRKILDTQISFTKDSENQTTTIINGKKYIARFNDTDKTITITSNDKTEVIDFNTISKDLTLWETAKNMAANLIETLKSAIWIEKDNKDTNSNMFPIPKVEKISKNEVEYISATDDVMQMYNEDCQEFIIFSKQGMYKIKYNKEDNTLEYLDETIELNDITLDEIKSAPLDFILKYKSKLKLTDLKSFISGEKTGVIKTIATTTTVAHELGHILDFNFKKQLSDDKDLIKIYKSEIEDFNSKYTAEAGKEYIRYFSQTGGSAGSGLSEIIAETNTILTTCTHDAPNLQARAQFLVQNFPKTIAYIATKFGLNQINQ